MMDTGRGIVFLPSTEIQFANMLPLVEAYWRTPHGPERVRLLIVDDLVGAARAFSLGAAPDGAVVHVGRRLESVGRVRLPSAAERRLVPEVLDTLARIDPGVVVVGNDTGVVRRQVLGALRRRYGTKVVLLQDGWLPSTSIRRAPLVDTVRRRSLVRMVLISMATSKRAPTYRWVNGFLGQMSDYYLVYSVLARHEFITAGCPVDSVIVTGSPRHQGMRFANGELHRTKQCATDRVCVVATTYYRRDDVRAAQREGLAWVARAAKALDQNVLVLLKPHPAEEVDLPLPAGVQVLDRKSQLSDALRGADVLYTFGSTASVDSLAMGLPVIQVAPTPLDSLRPGYHDAIPTAVCFDEVVQSMKDPVLWSRTRMRCSANDIIADAATGWDSITEVMRALDVIEQRGSAHAPQD